MSVNPFWSSRFHADRGDYDCPWCARTLKHKLSNSAKNPGRTFVSCAKDFGGCGMFCFLDAVPDEKHNPNKRARSDNGDTSNTGGVRSGGNNIVGPIVSAPNATETRLADLAAEIAALRSEVAKINDYIKEVNDQ